jgi:hypothetical protein
MKLISAFLIILIIFSNLTIFLTETNNHFLSSSEDQARIQNDEQNWNYNNNIQKSIMPSSRSIQSPNRKVTTNYEQNIVKLIEGQMVTGKTFKLNRNDTVIDTKLTLKGSPSFSLTDWEPIRCVSDHKYDGLSESPEIKIDRFGNPHLVWADNGRIEGSEGDWDIIYTRFNSFTKTWNPEEVISIDEPNSPSVMPDFIIDDSDRIHFVWVDQANISGNDKDKDIFYRSRNFDGDSWGATKILSNDTGIGNSENPMIAINKTGNIFVVWQDNEKIISNGTDYDILCKIKYRSNKTWSKTFCLSNNINDGDSVDPVITSDGDSVHVAWTETGNIDGSGNDKDIIMRTWDGKTWGTEVVITNLNYDKNSTSASIHAYDNALAVVWVETGDEDSNSTDKDVIFKRFENNEWNEVKVISDSTNEGDSIDPNVKIDYEGNIHVVWTEEEFSLTNIYYRHWDALKNKWSNIILISDYKQTGISNEPKIVISDDLRVDIAWTDNADIAENDYDPDIFYKRSKSIYPSNLKLNIVRTNGTKAENGELDWYYSGELNSKITLQQAWFPEKLNLLITEMEQPFEEFQLIFTSATNGSLNILEFSITTTATPFKPTGLNLRNEVLDHVVSNKPTFTWDFIDMDSTIQGGFEIRVGSEPELNDLWKYGPIDSNKESVAYNGDPLLDGKTYYFQVRVKDDSGAWSIWSESKNFTMNTMPEIRSLTPVAGSADDSIRINWLGFDEDNDNLTYTLEVFYDSIWHRLLTKSEFTKYNFDSTNLSTGESVDIKCRVYDGFEESSWFNEDGSITIFHNKQPEVVVLTPSIYNAIANDSFQISWESLDPEDDNLIVSIYYDYDTNLSEKTLIIENISDTGSYNWDTSIIDEGAYYICLKISDGKNINFDYSEGSVTINHKIDTRPPKVIATDPENDDIDISLNKKVKVRFSKEIDPITLENGNFIIRNLLNREVEGKIQWDSSFTEFTFTPIKNLEYSQVYTVTLLAGSHQKPGITDTFGNLLDGNNDGFEDGSFEDDLIWSFSTLTRSDVDPPRIIQTIPGDDSVDVPITPIIRAIFNSRMERNSTTPSTVFVIDESGNFIDGDMYLISGQNELQIYLLQDLEYNAKYTILITASVRNEEGYGLDGNENTISEGSPYDDYTFTFQTKKLADKTTNGDGEEGIDSILVLIILMIIVALILIFIFLSKSTKKSNGFKIHDIFVIYNDGRLIAHNTIEKKSNIDEGSMSGMLTAIQNFVAESFINVDSDDEKLEEIKYGKLKILLLHGESVYMAVICSAETITKKFKGDMENILRVIELKYGDELKNWDGSMKKVRDIEDLIKF